MLTVTQASAVCGFGAVGGLTERPESNPNTPTIKPPASVGVQYFPMFTRYLWCRREGFFIDEEKERCRATSLSCSSRLTRGSCMMQGDKWLQICHNSALWHFDYPFSGIHSRDYNILGSILESPIRRNYQLRASGLIEGRMEE